jgi:hypothetical protein
MKVTQIKAEFNQLLKNGDSLWSAVAWNRFGSQLRSCGIDRRKPLVSFASEIYGFKDDYQSGSKQPHSKGSAVLCTDLTYRLMPGRQV